MEYILPFVHGEFTIWLALTLTKEFKGKHAALICFNGQLIYIKRSVRRIIKDIKFNYLYVYKR